MKKYLILLIILIALLVRTVGINWDQNSHLHPDERFLTMVGVDLKIPASFFEYLDPHKSTLNPTNLLDENGERKYPFFVYGTFPITLTKIIATLTENDNYNGFTIVGRFLSAIMDIVVVIMIYKIIELLELKYHYDKKIKYWGAFFYTICVLPIQLSHFLTVDIFLNTFSFVSLYFALRFNIKKNVFYLIFSGLFLGLALASKITAVYSIPLFALLIFPPFLNFSKNKLLTLINQHKVQLITAVFSLFAFLFISYLSLRLSNPYMFENNSLINPQISNILKQNWDLLSSWNNKDVWYPPGVQWINKPPITFALYNLIFFGFGFPLFVLSILGIIYILKKKYILLTLTVLWVLIIFVYQSTQYVKSIRYFLVLYPLLAVYAAFGYVYINKFLAKFISVLILISLLIWPLSFLSIYLKPHPRITASRWIYDNVPLDKTIAWELWDDPLPLRLPNYTGKTYTQIELPVFDNDTPKKWQTINQSLEKSDYYILSSNRAWGSIPTAPHLYPQTTKFYKDLFSAKTKFIKIAEFTSYPSLRYLGIPIDFKDEIAEEAFTVYDHPKVMIFKKFINE